MSIDSRFYGGKLLRPRPEVYWSEEQRLLIIATAWGNSQSSSLATEIITDYFSTAHSDIETTSPFPIQTCLTAEENYLRVAALLVNEAIYRDLNQNDYSSGLELFALHYGPRQCSFVQVGQPSCLLSRSGLCLFPLSAQMDLSLESGSKSSAAPLPSNLLGLDPTANIEVKNFRPKTGDKLFLLSRAQLSGRLFTLNSAESNLERITEVLAQDDENQPFWLGQFNLPNVSE